MSSSPWTYYFHPISWAVVVIAAVAYVVAVRRPEWRATPKQMASYFGGLALLLVAVTWPLADLAARWSLTALVCQRLILTLGVPPLIILGLPQTLVVRLTRPAPIDAIVRMCSRPVVAVGVFTVVAVGTLTTASVDGQSTSLAVRALLDVVLLVAGAALWMPVLTCLPGTNRPSPLGQAGYLIVQAIVPSFLAIVWIFARHPLYPAFAQSGRIAGVSPLLDQQIAGFVAKFGTILALMTVAFVRLSRAHHASAVGQDPDPLRWADVERHLERVARREQSARSPWWPRSALRDESPSSSSGEDRSDKPPDTNGHTPH